MGIGRSFLKLNCEGLLGQYLLLNNFHRKASLYWKRDKASEIKCSYRQQFLRNFLNYLSVLANNANLCILRSSETF